jgi:hypothetical protein
LRGSTERRDPGTEQICDEAALDGRRHNETIDSRQSNVVGNQMDAVASGALANWEIFTGDGSRIGLWIGCSSAPYSVLDDCHVNTTSLSVFWIVKGAERDSASRIFWIGVRGAARGLPVPGDPGTSDRPSGEEEVIRADGLLVPARPPFGDPPDDDLRRRGRSGDCGLPGVDGMLSEAGGDEWDRAGTR